ncbi:MAG: sialidase family protein [Crocinitomicaceae bacterium]
MKNSKANFAFSILLLFLFSCGIISKKGPNEYTQKIQYSKTEKVHARAITASDKELIIAASDGNVYFYPKESKQVYSLFPSPKKEYRDVIFNENKIVILASGDSSEVTSYKLTNADKLYITPFDGTFLDGMDFFGNVIFLMGDPKNEHFSLYTSEDWGETWQVIKNPPNAFAGEAGFAASGTNVKAMSQYEYLFVSGGDSSRFFKTVNSGETWMSNSMGFPSCPTCGAYSFVVTKKSTIVAVGGDYLKPNQSEGTCRISNDGGKTWKSPKINPTGYRSNITEIEGVLYCCGTNGIDYSKNQGKTWLHFADGNYFTLCKFDNQLAASSTQGSIYLFKLK